jgi:predicted esterase
MNALNLPLPIRAVGRRRQPARNCLGLGLCLALGLTACAEAGSEPDLDPAAYPPIVVADAGATGGGATTGGSTALPPNLSGGGTMGGWLANAGGTTGTAGGTGLAGGTAGTGSTAGGSVGASTGGGTLTGTLGGGTGGIAGGFTAGGTLAGLSGGGTSGSSPIGGLLGGTGLIGGGAGGGMTGGSSTPIDPSAKQPDASKLPQVSGACPDFRDGSTAMVAGINVKFWSGAAGKKGPLIFYWHGTGGSSDEAVGSLTGNGLGPVLNDIKAQGGIVASPDNSTGSGNSVDTVVWTTDDFKAADQIVACAVQAGRIDPGRIHALGFSAGGLMAGTMYYVRSNYLASVVTYSGGTSPWPGNSVPQDPSNKLPIMLFHGGDGDWVVLAFKDQSIELATDAKAKGRFSVICDHGGGHGIPSAGPAAAWTFFKAHPYNTQPEPWTSLPSGVPSYCKIF